MSAPSSARIVYDLGEISHDHNFIGGFVMWFALWRVFFFHLTLAFFSFLKIPDQFSLVIWEATPGIAWACVSVMKCVMGTTDSEQMISGGNEVICFTVRFMSIMRPYFIFGGWASQADTGYWSGPDDRTSSFF